MFQVRIRVYDISMGMAKTMGKMLTGLDIQGVWHTGIVVYGNQYFFGGGIQKVKVGSMQFGALKQQASLGSTQVPIEVFQDFLKDIEGQFTPQKYDLFKHNCNHFSERCCQFLLNCSIPAYVRDLPQEVLKTPFGQMIKPFLDNMSKATGGNYFGASEDQQLQKAIAQSLIHK